MAKGGRKRPQTADTFPDPPGPKKQKGIQEKTSQTITPDRSTDGSTKEFPNLAHEVTQGMPSRALEPGASESLYIKNLNDQVSITDLRVSLYMLFSNFGHVVAVNAHKSPKMRGQAHISFGNPRSASAALAGLQGRQFFNKELVIAYAKQKSHRLEWLQRDLDAQTYRSSKML